jgi:hypothetical protein
MKVFFKHGDKAMLSILLLQSAASIKLKIRIKLIPFSPNLISVRFSGSLKLIDDLNQR